MKEKVLRLNLYVGFLILVFSALLLILNVSFIKTWFYSFAWWSFILILDSINFRMTRSSLLSESFKIFIFTAFISVFVWLIFELFNLRVKNWTYHGLPSNIFERWSGYFIAFATVVPAMLEISIFFRGLLKKKRLALFRIKGTSSFLKVFIILGLTTIFLPLVWPRLFFPLIWLCFIFLLEPINFWLKNETLLEDMEKKEWSKFWSWILAGLVAGFFWEFWNFWAGSHWEYFIPYLNFWKVFQMPVFGFTGFMPFALEVFAIYQLLLFVYKKIQKKIVLQSLIVILLLLFYVGAFYLIDSFTLVH